jgi:hypothetical protein
VLLCVQKLLEEGVKLDAIKPSWTDVIIPLINESLNTSVIMTTRRHLMKQLAVVKLLIDILFAVFCALH